MLAAASFALKAEALDVIYINVWSILISLANLLILYLVFKRFLFKPVMAMVSRRQEKVQEELRLAQVAKEEAEADRLAYEARLAKAEEDATDVIRAANRTANRASEEILGEAKEKAAAILRQAEADIAQEKKKAVHQLKTELSDISLSIAETVIGREVGEEDHRRLIQDAIRQVGDGDE